MENYKNSQRQKARRKVALKVAELEKLKKKVEQRDELLEKNKKARLRSEERHRGLMLHFKQLQEQLAIQIQSGNAPEVQRGDH